MTYRVELTRAAARDIRKLPDDVAQRVRAAVVLLADDPRPQDSLKLTGRENTWRIRVGDYRVLYEIDRDQMVVLVVRLRHRRDVFR